MGKRWSIESRKGWHAMLAYYRAVLQNVRIKGFVGFNVSGSPQDFRFFRYAYTSCLMDDGYFSFTDETNDYSSVPFFDEYDVDLGKATDLPRTTPWQKGIYRRLFEKGMVLVNPTAATATVAIEPGYRTITGKQDTKINHGRTVESITLAAKDGIVLLKQRKD